MAQRISMAAQREERRDTVMKLVLEGFTYRQIEARTGFSRGTIGRDIHARLESAAAECPHTKKYRELHRLRINQLLLRLWPMAMEGDLSAVDRVLRLLEREAKLLGLDKPQELQHSGEVALQKPDMSALTDKDVESLRLLIAEGKHLHLLPEAGKE